MQREKIAMIQLVGWICLIQLLSPVFSDTTLTTGSLFPNEKPTTLNLTENEKLSTVEAEKNISTTEPTTITQNLSTGTDNESGYTLKSEDIFSIITSNLQYSQKPGSPYFETTAGSEYKQKPEEPNLKLFMGSGFTQASQDTSFGTNVDSEKAQKPEDPSFGIITRSGFVQNSGIPSFGFSIGSGYTLKSDNPFFGLVTGSEYMQKSDEPSFGINTESEYTHKSETPSLGVSTGSEQKSETPSFDVNTGSEIKSETHPLGLDKELEITELSEKSSFGISTGSQLAEKSEEPSIGISTGSGLTQKSDELSFGVSTGSESTQKSGDPSLGIRTVSELTQKLENPSFVTQSELQNSEKTEDHSTEDMITFQTILTAKKPLQEIYEGEMTITYQSTTANLKESENTDQINNSSIPNTTKILYFDEKPNLEKEDDSKIADKSSTIIVTGTSEEMTQSKVSFNEKTSKDTFSEATTTPMPSSVTTPYYKKITTESLNTNPNPIYSGNVNKYSVKTNPSKNKSPYPSIVSVLSVKGGSHIRNSRTAFENIQSSSNDNQTQNFNFVTSSTNISGIVSPNSDVNSSAFKKIEEKLGNRQLNKTLPSDQSEGTQTPNPNEVPLTNSAATTIIMEGSIDASSEYATETNNNATRSPKKIQEEEEFEERYPEGRVRPILPDPGYAHYPEKDTVRPYRPDAPLHKFPYYRPTPDYRTPIVKEEKDYTRPPRPESEYPRVSFRPNYLYSKTSQDDLSVMPVSVFATSPKPYKPSFNRPSYHPQSSFGRPYRPDYHRPSSKPTDDYSVTKISEIKGGATQEADVSEHSRADYDYTKLSEMLSTYTKIYNADARPSGTSSDLTKPYGSSYDADMSMHSKATSPDDLMTAIREMAKVSKPDMNTNRPSSFYPRPGFGNNYQASDTSVKPFSVGTVTSAKNLTRVEFIKADCFDNHMKVTMRFNGTFNGLVYSSGYASDSSCSYVNGSGRNHYEFYIRLNRCGTLGQQEVAEQRMRSLARRRQERAQYLVNTVTVQYNPVIEEDIDEHFRVTCEYGYDFWKTVTFPVMSVESSAVKVRTGSPVVFTLPPPQCNMEIRNGFGPSGTRVSGPVNVGDPLTLVIHMKSESTGFDILVKNCYAHNGAQKRLQLIDSNGCVVQEKLVSAFRGVHSPDRSQQITLYSYLKAFRFTGSPALYIECDVHMCHGSCPPQRCYWRHMYKRSANEVTTQASTTEENVVSESVSLFQALEVRHEEVDSPYLLSLKNANGFDSDDVVCLRTGGFGAILACLLLLMMSSSFAAVCMCLRMRKMKKLVEAPDSRRFIEFDGHVPKK